MKNSALISLLLLLCGCSVTLPGHYQRLSVAGDPAAGLIPWFRGEGHPVLYKAAIDAMKNHFSGLMVIKPVTEDSHRVVFVTETGIKIFDMEFFRNGDFILHYCIEVLNRKPVIHTLRNDVGLMIRNVPDRDKKIKVFTDRESSQSVMLQRSGPGAAYYFTGAGKHRVNEIIQRSAAGKKVNLRFYSQNDDRLDSVKISHYNIKLEIHLSTLHENRTGVSE